MPVGLVETAEFSVMEQRLSPGDKIVIYSDGVTEAQNLESAFFGKKRLREVVNAHAADSCAAIHDAIQEAVTASQPMTLLIGHRSLARNDVGKHLHLLPSRCFMRGSSASRAASPIRLTLRIAIESSRPGQKISDGLI